jgi:hypothetical protein
MPAADAVSPQLKAMHHCYWVWSPSVAEDKKPSAQSTWVWRGQEFLGIESAQATLPPAAAETAQADVVVLESGGLGFEKQSAQWPQALCDAAHPPWVVLKTIPALLRGDLFKHALRHCGGRLIVVLAVDDLRASAVHISRGLSWERTAEDLVRELTTNLAVNSVLRCAHTVVSLGTAGALLFSRVPQPDAAGRATTGATLVYDPRKLEGDWEGFRTGIVPGALATLTAGIVRQLAQGLTGHGDLVEGLKAGVGGMRRLHELGFGPFTGHGPTALRFPADEVAAALRAEQASLCSSPVPPLDISTVHDPPATAGSRRRISFRPAWRLGLDPARLSESLPQVIETLTIRGAHCALPAVPSAAFADFVSIDRQEIEALRSMRGLMSEYVAGNQSKPLSLAVLGPPGSGKSYSVEQVAESVRPGKVRVLTFNLSQFSDAGELHGAFHQVRDAALQGNLPLVFWDEFDTTFGGRPLGWLQYFLAPMQDGSFRGGQLVHPIGRSIFVFAGSTCSQVRHLGKKLSPQQRREVKLRDFVSRLKGFLSVRGPNRLNNAPDRDPYYLLRRGQVLRSLLLRHAPQLFAGKEPDLILRIDRGVLRAALHVSRYKHGARSLESLILTSALVGKSSFERACLPADEQTELHVPSREFRALVQEPFLT